MNSDTFEGQWTRLRGEITAWWDTLTDGDLENVAGKKDRLVALVQEKYQYTHARAQQEADRRLQEYRDKLGASGPTSRAASAEAMMAPISLPPRVSMARLTIVAASSIGARAGARGDPGRRL